MFNLTNANPTLMDVTFANNSAVWGAGGMYNGASSPTLTDVTFSGNNSAEGAGMYNRDSASPVLVNVTFSGNTALSWGGGMYNNNHSNPSLTNVIFSGNTATNYGAGGMYNLSSSPTLANVTFSGNSASYGGGMYNLGSSPTLANVIVWGNTPTQNQIYNNSSTPVVTYSDVQGGYVGTGNINADPLFVDAAGGDLRLQLTSPAIDAGNNAAMPSGVLTDLLGFPRLIDIASVPDTGNGTPPLVDMGAYEAQIAVYLPVMNR